MVSVPQAQTLISDLPKYGLPELAFSPFNSTWQSSWSLSRNNGSTACDGVHGYYPGIKDFNVAEQFIVIISKRKRAL
jgi:hypothetical protein